MTDVNKDRPTTYSVSDAFRHLSMGYPYGWAHGMVVSDYSPERKFCTYCGSALVQNRKTEFYDPQTGEPGYKWTLGCPKYGDTGWHDHWWRYDDPEGAHK
jgi:hypothetical protein